MSGHTPTPLILDSTILDELARGDLRVVEHILGRDAVGQPMVLSTLSITRTLTESNTEAAKEAMTGLAKMKEVLVAPLADAKQAVALAETARETGLGLDEAHVALIAHASVCPILTLDAKRWTEPSHAMPQRLHTLEICDPDDPGDSAAGQ